VAPPRRGPAPAALLTGIIRASVTAIAAPRRQGPTRLDLRSPTGFGGPAKLRKLIAVIAHFNHPPTVLKNCCSIAA